MSDATKLPIVLSRDVDRPDRIYTAVGDSDLIKAKHVSGISDKTKSAYDFVAINIHPSFAKKLVDLGLAEVSWKEASTFVEDVKDLTEAAGEEPGSVK